jgi:hypothetical protein
MGSTSRLHVMHLAVLPFHSMPWRNGEQQCFLCLINIQFGWAAARRILCRGWRCVIVCLPLCLILQWKGKQDKSKDAFNFFLSQLCIQIEQAFGWLATKWQVFKKPMELVQWWTPLLIEKVLHNFCIKQHEDVVINLAAWDPSDFAPNSTEYLNPIGEGVEPS